MRTSLLSLEAIKPKRKVRTATEVRLLSASVNEDIGRIIPAINFRCQISGIIGL
jgi:hypothetical protein